MNRSKNTSLHLFTSEIKSEVFQKQYGTAGRKTHSNQLPIYHILVMCRYIHDSVIYYHVPSELLEQSNVIKMYFVLGLY